MSDPTPYPPAPGGQPSAYPAVRPAPSYAPPTYGPPGHGAPGYGAPGYGAPGSYGVPGTYAGRPGNGPPPYPAAPYPQPPADAALARPVAVQPVPGTPFAVAVVGVAPTSSGPATGSLVAGVGSILVSLVVACFGLTGAASGWGPVVSGAFAILAGIAGLAGVVLGLVALRQVRAGTGPTGRTVSGRGLAIAGMICGGVGLALTVLAFVAGFALVLSA